MNKIFSIALLATMLTVGCSRTYNVGSCASDAFLGLSFTTSYNKLVITDVARGPHTVAHSPNPLVFKKVSSSGGVYIYESVEENDVLHMELRFKGDRVAGILYLNGEKLSYVFGKVGVIGNLGKDASLEFGTCIDLHLGDQEQKIQNYLDGVPTVPVPPQN